MNSLSAHTAAQTCASLLEEYRNAGERAGGAQKLKFAGVDGKDVYNIAAPFRDDGELVIAGRVESRDSEHSDVVFFTERDGVWVPREGAPVFRLQDPFHTVIGGNLVLGGVEVFPDPGRPGYLMWRTVFYRGSRIAELERFFEGPDGMKDIRLVELADGSVGVFTRPQGEKGGRGKIGFVRIGSLEELTVKAIEEAPLLDAHFTDEEWGGANEAHLLAGGLIGVLGHIACYDDQGNRHYYPIVFVYHPLTGERTALKMIAERADFVPGPSKRPDLEDVVFSGGLIRHGDGTATLYAGVGDAEAQRIEIRDPFAAFENSPAGPGIKQQEQKS
ncbi:hypothetical protein PACILC2_08600 [Paenibacillus cisolokensis]|uniref:DUF1861 family protein n=1 Tax=Paenibacillus cisolokensis TaxID=1658519 RepID=A0ABQ4N297_9BACL|nr:DUF1861 family protein [Paenibacillus cisolokensis]GIQ62292.1 hypothetical protein PACILC2_08600 [Paenibacillus cisolokensis]